MGSEWDRVASDPALLARVRARYTGSGDVLDQLWWAEHPGRPTPSGTPDPLDAAVAARRDRYRPGARAEDTAWIEGLERQAADDRAAAVRATEESAAEPAPSPPPPPGWRRRTAAIGAAALVVGVVLGGIAEHVRGQPPTDAPALAVFDRPARVPTTPPTALAALLTRATVRELRSYSSIGMVAYGVRTADGRICLMTVVLGTRASAACTTRTAFASVGLTWVGIAGADPVDDAGTRPSEEISLVWNPDGTIAVTPVERT